MRLLTRWPTLCVAAAACGLATPPAPGPAAAKPRPVEVLTIATTPVRDTSEYLGTLISRQSVNIVPQVGGYVRKIIVRPGKQVEAGETLLEVDAREESAALNSAQAMHVSARSTRELAERNLARTKSLYAEGLVSAQEMERAQASVAEALASTQSTAAQVSQRRVELQYHEVKAPFAGTVGDVVARVGDLVTPTTLLTTVAQVGVLEVTVAVPAERARAASLSMPVELLTPTGDVLLTCPAYFVSPQADGRSQLVDVKAVFRNTVDLRPNELVRARLVFGVRQAIEVPALSVVFQSGQAFVFVVVEKDGETTVARRPVKLGPLTERGHLIEHGLVPGERIAVSSIQALRDGARVIPQAPADRRSPALDAGAASRDAPP